MGAGGDASGLDDAGRTCGRRLDAVTAEDEPWWLEEGDPDPLDDGPPGEYDLREIGAQCRQAAEDQARAAATAARLGLTGAMAAVAALNGRSGPPRSPASAPSTRILEQIHPIVTSPRNEPTQRERLVRRARTCRTPYPWAEMPGAQQTGWCWE